MSTRWPKEPDLRGWLALLRERGELRTLAGEIDSDQDVAAVLEHADGRYAVGFDAVRGAKFPLVGNTVPSRRHSRWHWTVRRQRWSTGSPTPSAHRGRVWKSTRPPRPCSHTRLWTVTCSVIFRHAARTRCRPVLHLGAARGAGSAVGQGEHVDQPAAGDGSPRGAGTHASRQAPVDLRRARGGGRISLSRCASVSIRC
jgi:hypothetical protein